VPATTEPAGNPELKSLLNEAAEENRQPTGSERRPTKQVIVPSDFNVYRLILLLGVSETHAESGPGSSTIFID
jgi:hypothetical protein